jgi:hypothetical protein
LVNGIIITCSNPNSDPAIGKTVPFNNHGITSYITTTQAFLLIVLPIVMIVFGLSGVFLRRKILEREGKTLPKLFSRRGHASRNEGTNAGGKPT